jgi:hypothetical protein
MLAPDVLARPRRARFQGRPVRPFDVPPSLFEEPAMAQQTTEPPAKSVRPNTASGVAVITAALMVGLAPFAAPEAAATAFAPGRTRLGRHRP